MKQAAIREREDALRREQHKASHGRGRPKRAKHSIDVTHLLTPLATMMRDFGVNHPNVADAIHRTRDELEAFVNRDTADALITELQAACAVPQQRTA